MARHVVTEDLFGKPVRQRRPRYEAALEKGERKTLPERTARVRWLSDVIPKNRMFGMPLETALIFGEAKASFVYGNFVAEIVLTQCNLPPARGGLPPLNTIRPSMSRVYPRACGGT